MYNRINIFPLCFYIYILLIKFIYMYIYLQDAYYRLLVLAVVTRDPNVEE